MSQKPGGVVAMGSGIWPHMPSRINELFVMSVDSNFATLSPVSIITPAL